MTDLKAKDSQHPYGAIRIWLASCCLMIAAMAVIGAITRLTESGLSIVSWHPVKDMLPPLSDAAWQQAFDEYRQIPQYRLLNSGMSLEDFKTIYFWEWLHRLWGRLIGIVYALPFFWFLWRRRLPKTLVWKLWLGLVLGGLQGLLGWFMVRSGLEDLVYVSHLRLAAHLGLALVIYAYLFWLWLDLDPAPPQRLKATPRAVVLHGTIALGFLTVTIIWGAFTAGLKAGWVYNSFPLMDGEFLPSAAWTLNPLWVNFFNNTALVQFCHRWLAILTSFVILSWCWRLSPTAADQRPIIALGAMVSAQVAIGITTLIYAVPILLGTLHQLGAILLLTLILWNMHSVTRARH
jgi:heme a synthase